MQLRGQSQEFAGVCEGKLPGFRSRPRSTLPRYFTYKFWRSRLSNSGVTLEYQLEQFRSNRFIAMPLAGAIAWTGIGIVGATGNVFASVWAIFIGTGIIFYLGIGIGKLIGEDVLGRDRQSSFFDRLFLLGAFQAILVYLIAIPFFQLETSSLPMTVGVLTGLMWIPFSALAGHWVGLFHGIARTVLVVGAYYLLPDYRFAAIPAIIVGIYAVTIYILAMRYREIEKPVQVVA